MLIHFEQTHRQTPHDSMSHACKALCGKKCQINIYAVLFNAPQCTRTTLHNYRFSAQTAMPCFVGCFD